MIVVDSSAIVAIFQAEPEADLFWDRLARSGRNVCSSATFVECALVLIGARRDLPLDDVVQLFERLQIERIDLTAEHALIAAEAFRRFGKGRHPAKLNLGDCFSYALAKSLNAPLLFKGDDFARTDIMPAFAP